MTIPQELDRKFLRFALTHFGGLIRSVSRYPKHWLVCAVFLMFFFADLMDLMLRARTTQNSVGSLLLSGWLLHGAEASCGLLSGVCVLGVVTHLVCISHEFTELGKSPQIKDKALFAANAMSLGYLWALAWLYSVVFAVHQLSPSAHTQDVAIGSWVFVMLVTAASQAAIYKYGLKKYLIESRFPQQQKKIDEKGDDVYIRARLSMLQEMSTYLEKDPVCREPPRDTVEESLRIEVRNLNAELNLARETKPQVVEVAPGIAPELEVALHERHLMEQQLDAVRLENRSLRDQLQDALQEPELKVLEMPKPREPDFLEELKEQQRLCDEARQGFEEKQAELRTQIQAFEQLSEHSLEMSKKIVALQQQLQETRVQLAHISEHSATLVEANQTLKNDAEQINQRYDTLVEAVKTRMGEWKDKQLAFQENERLCATLTGVEAKCTALVVLNDGLSSQLQQLKMSDSTSRAELLHATKQVELFEKEKTQLGTQLQSLSQVNTALSEEMQRLQVKLAEQQSNINLHETSIKDQYVSKTEMETLSQALEKLQATHSIAIAELKLGQDNIDTANALARQQSLQIKDLETKLETAEVSVDRLEAQVTTQQRFLDNVGATEITLQTLRAQLQAEQERANLLNEELQARDQEMAQEIQKRKRVESKMLVVERANEATKGNAAELRSTHQVELESLQATNVHLTEILEEKKVQLDRLQEEVVTLQVSRVLSLELETIVQEKSLQVEALKQELSTTKAEQVLLQGELSEFTAQLAASAVSIQSLQNELAAAKENYSLQTAKAADELTNWRQDSAVRETAQLARAEGVQQEIDSQECLSQKEHQVASLQREVAVMTATNDALLIDVATLQAALVDFRERTSGSADEVHLLRQELSSLQTTNSRLATQACNVKDNEIKLQSLQQELLGLQSTSARLAEDVRGHERTAERGKKIYDNQIREIKALEASNEKLTKSLDEHISERQDIESRLHSQLLSELSHTRNQLQNSQQELSLLQTELSNFQENYQTSQEEITNLRAINARLLEQMVPAGPASNGQLDTAEKEIELEVSALKRTNSQLAAEIMAQGGKMQELQARVQAMEQADEAKKHKFQTVVTMAKKAQVRCALLEASLKNAGLTLPP